MDNQDKGQNLDSLEKRIQEIEDRLSKLDYKRIRQQDIMPDAIKMRHIAEGVRFIRSGLLANRPTAETPLQGSAVYYTTDTNVIYLYDGSVWRAH
jgi:hypothetical protein